MEYSDFGLNQIYNKMKKQKIGVTCKHCGYTWESKSRKKFISCPDCLGKTETHSIKFIGAGDTSSFSHSSFSSPKPKKMENGKYNQD